MVKVDLRPLSLVSTQVPLVSCAHSTSSAKLLHVVCQSSWLSTLRVTLWATWWGMGVEVRGRIHETNGTLDQTPHSHICLNVVSKMRVGRVWEPIVHACKVIFTNDSCASCIVVGHSSRSLNITVFPFLGTYVFTVHFFSLRLPPFLSSSSFPPSLLLSFLSPHFSFPFLPSPNLFPPSSPSLGWVDLDVCSWITFVNFTATHGSLSRASVSTRCSRWSSQMWTPGVLTSLNCKVILVQI